MIRRILLLVGLLALGLFTSPASAEIYRWVDAQGTSHYTDRPEEVPPEFRKQILGAEEMESIPFNQLDGLNVLPGEATSPKEKPGAAEVPFNLQSTQDVEAWFDAAGPVLIGGVALAMLVVIGLMFAFTAWILLMACKVVGQDHPGFKKAYGIVIVQFLGGLLATPGLVLLVGQPEATDISGLIRFQAGSAVLGILVNALVLRGMLTETFPRALGISIVAILIMVGIGIVLGVGVPLLVMILA